MDVSELEVAIRVAFWSIDDETINEMCRSFHKKVEEMVSLDGHAVVRKRSRSAANNEE